MLLTKIINMQKKVWEDVQLKSLGNYPNLYAQSYTVLQADVFQNFRNKGIETYELDPCSLDQLSAPELAWKSFFKKTKIELELSTNTDMQQLIEKGIRNGIYHPTYRHAKVNNKYTKGYNKDNKSPYLIYWDANNFYEWIISKKLS